MVPSVQGPFIKKNMRMLCYEAPVLGGSWGLVTTYSCGYNPILVIGVTPTRSFGGVNSRVIRPVISSCYFPRTSRYALIMGKLLAIRILSLATWQALVTVRGNSDLQEDHVCAVHATASRKDLWRCS